MKSAVDNLLRLASFTHEYLWNSSNLLHVTASFPFYCWVIICCMKVYLSYHSLSIHIWIVSAAKSLRSCLTLCDPMDSSPPGSPIPGILQARTLECVAISFSNAWKWKVKVKSLSRVRLLWPHGPQRTRLLHPRDIPGKSTGVGCHCLLQDCF